MKTVIITKNQYGDIVVGTERVSADVARIVRSLHTVGQDILAVKAIRRMTDLHLYEAKVFSDAIKDSVEGRTIAYSLVDIDLGSYT